ncbi:MAG: Crp/Fnr family transcriptional regulator [Lagierella massiliensis]|nr:Crp/Fnr family transcriptional regulator [Lagierella massiliensis]
MAKMSQLFNDMSKTEIDNFIVKNKGFRKKFLKGEEIFSQGTKPQYLFILEEGSVVIENISKSGRRSIVNRFSEEGTVFGEVYLYLPKRDYDYSCIADIDTIILKIPKKAFTMKDESFQNSRVINNMMLILSQKALYLNQKLLIQSGKTLREKLSRFFVNSARESSLDLEFNREELADFFGVSRPSISREIMSMKRDGLIELKGNKILINREKLEKVL